MKKLLVLTTLVVLVAGAAGCQSCTRWFRGTRAQTPAVMTPMVYADPCAPACDPCAPAACGPVGTMTPAVGPMATYGGN